MNKSESITKIAPALVKAQRKMGAATKGAANPYFKSKYADLGAVMEVVKDPLNDEGISILQPVRSVDGSHFVETMLLHESGEFISSEPMKLELNKTDMQSLGSAITYARRYTLQSLLSIPAEDDDGEATMNRSKQASTSKNFEPAPKELKDAAKATVSKGAVSVVAPALTVVGTSKALTEASVIASKDPKQLTNPSPAEKPKSFTSFRQNKGLNI